MMKKIIICILMTMLLAVGTAEANTIASSTMYFQGTLTETSIGSGVYTGTIDAIAGQYYTPGGPGTTYNGTNWVTPDGEIAQGGWDVYAQEGATAYVENNTPLIATIGADHDAYSSAGPWGTFYDPDVADWYHYQLTLEADHWYLEYKGENLGTPMSGEMDWVTMLAMETDTGSYRGTVPSDPDANSGEAATNGGGAQAWDMDWTWGSEVVPLEFPGFAVSVQNITGTTNYLVKLTPVPVPGAVLLGLLGLSAAGIKLRKFA